VDIKGPFPKVPVDPTIKLLPYDGRAGPHQVVAYQQRTGSTTYSTTISRPDTAWITKELATFNQNPSPDHREATERLLRYLYGSRYLALQFGGTDIEFIDGEPIFRATSNASFADDVTTRRSTQGFLFQLLGGTIDWKSTKQDSVSTSTTEAELKSVSVYAA